jgi:hypothetical protein
MMAVSSPALTSPLHYSKLTREELAERILRASGS